MNVLERLSEVYFYKKCTQLSVGKVAVKAWEKMNRKILEGVRTSDCLAKPFKF